MSIIVLGLISPIHFFQFFLLWIIIYKSKTTTKVSTDDFEIDINGISGALEMWKNTVSA